MDVKTKMEIDVAKLMDDPPALLAYLLLCASENARFNTSFVPKIRWIAMDGDGDWYGYKQEPLASEQSGVWISNVGSQIVTAIKLIRAFQDVKPWQQSVFEVTL